MKQVVHKLVSTAVLASSMLLSVEVNATTPSYNYLGLDLLSIYVPLTSQYTKILPKHTLGANIFLGYRATDSFGLEFGYSWNERKTKAMHVKNGDNAFGVTANVSATHIGKVRLKNTHGDAIFYMKYRQSLDLLAVFGLGFSRQAFKFSHDPASTTSTISPVVNSIKGKTMAIARIGCGVQGKFANGTGARLMWIYETLGRVRIRSEYEAVSKKPFKHGQIISAGLYWQI